MVYNASIYHAEAILELSLEALGLALDVHIGQGAQLNLALSLDRDLEGARSTSAS